MYDLKTWIYSLSASLQTLSGAQRRGLQSPPLNIFTEMCESDSWNKGWPYTGEEQVQNSREAPYGHLAPVRIS